MLETICSESAKAVGFDAWRAERIEAAGVTLEVDGVSVTVPPIDCWPNGEGLNDVDMLRLVLGDAAGPLFDAGLTVAALLKIMVGTDDAGKSGASPST